MSEMIERVARAIREGRQCGSPGKPLTVPCPFCLWGPDDRTAEFDETGCLWLARTAIAAMREPTESMVVAGECLEDFVNTDDGNGVTVPGKPEATWHAMIDDALVDSITAKPG